MPTPRIGSPTVPTMLGAKWDWSRVDRFSPYLRHLGSGATFYEMVWCDVEPQPGHLEWQRTDAVAQQTRQLGMSLMLKIRVGACWATSAPADHVRGQKHKTESEMPRDLEMYTSFVRSVVQRYSQYGVHEYALENEVNGESFWGGTPMDYVKLTTVGAAAVRSGDPKALVVDSGISSTAYGIGIADRLLAAGQSAEALAAYTRYYSRRGNRQADFAPASDVAALRTALQSPQARRNLEFLAAARQLAQRRVIDVRQLHFYERWDNVPAVLDYLRATMPAGLPIEAWETGMFWPGGDPDPQVRTAEVARTTSLLLAGGVRRVIWLPLAFDPSGRHADEPRYGLVEDSGSVRPAGVAFAALADAARGSVASAVTVGRVQGVAFPGDTTTKLVLWSDSGGVLAGTAPTGATARSLSGRPAAWPSDGLRIGSDPVVLSVPGSLNTITPRLS